MSDKADPLRTYHQTMIEKQAQPVTMIDGVTINGSNGEQELQGPIGSRPNADAVPTNSTFFALDEGKLYWTNGSAWQPVGGS